MDNKKISVDDEDDGKAYTWEGNYEKTWDVLKEDESGSLQESIENEIEKAKKRRLNKRRNVNRRLGMMRHVYVIIDMSLAMNDQDLKPNRGVVTLKLLEKFVLEFFDQNPISQLGFITTSSKRAFVLSDLSGSPHAHIKILKNMSAEIIKTNGKNCHGEPSLQNSLELAEKSLSQMPSHTSREVILLFASLTSCDPDPIQDTINLMARKKICCNFVGLSAEVHVCKRLADATGGKFGVILDESHYWMTLTDFIPPPEGSATESSLMKMGFPKQVPVTDGRISFNMTTKKFNVGGFYCPQCLAKYSQLPVDCQVCQLTLVSAPHLARSYHHLFPLPSFTEEDSSGSTKLSCYACMRSLFNSKRKLNVYSACERCTMKFCLDCNLYIHETLHSCPGCINHRCEMNIN